jgi:hypothetical protein
MFQRITELEDPFAAPEPFKFAVSRENPFGRPPEAAPINTEEFFDN